MQEKVNDEEKSCLLLPNGTQLWDLPEGLHIRIKDFTNDDKFITSSEALKAIGDFLISSHSIRLVIEGQLPYEPHPLEKATPLLEYIAQIRKIAESLTFNFKNSENLSADPVERIYVIRMVGFREAFIYPVDLQLQKKALEANIIPIKNKRNK